MSAAPNVSDRSDDLDLADLGLIGNCQHAALVSRRGEIVWSCLPRFDSDPVFASLLDPDGGSFRVGLPDGSPGQQRYLPNTNVLETRFEGPGGAFRVLDFAPRFQQHARFFRPTMIVRMVEPLAGTPLFSVRCTPRLGWSKTTPTMLSGSNHVRWEGFASPLRLTTDVPLAYLEGQPVALTGKKHLVLTWGAPVEEALAPLCERFLDETVRYWQRWVKHSNLPTTHQRTVIRSALALKLHCYEDTGAIVAATTTSLPEAPGAGRTWDYRYCWLRDSYYVLEALRLLGHFEEREAFVQYLIGIAAATPGLDLAPLYRVDGRSDLDERILGDWRGFRGEGPVRVGNGAALHKQHDIFGEAVLALAPVFLDERFHAEQTPEILALTARLADKAISVAGSPDAGIWEVRGQWRPQTFSTLMSWAACDRMAMIAGLHPQALPAGAAERYRGEAARLQAEILARAWSAERGAFVSAYDGNELDAALLQMVPLRFLPPNDPRLGAAVDAIRRDLARGDWLYRYLGDDGLGRMSVAFVICTFWLVEALARLGRRSEARILLDKALATASPLGLFSEDVAPDTGRLWGNYPQAYSHVGVIHAAFAAAPTWDEVG